MKIEIDNARTDGSELTIEDEDIGRRVVTVDGFKFNLRSRDPYAFVTVVPESGSVPRELKGEFTSGTDALIAIRSYVNRKKAEKSKPPLDKNTRKVKEILEAREA
jgi:hypothetical protein